MTHDRLSRRRPGRPKGVRNPLLGKDEQIPAEALRLMQRDSLSQRAALRAQIPIQRVRQRIRQAIAQRAH